MKFRLNNFNLFSCFQTFAVFMTIVFAYAICWLPIHVITIIGDITPSIYDVPSVHVLWLFAHFLAVSNAAINPVIVLVMQRKFRQRLNPVLTVLTKAEDYRRSSASSRKMERTYTFNFKFSP